MKFKVWVASLFFFLASPAAATSWAWVGTADVQGQFNMYVDRDSVRQIEKDVVQAWTFSYRATPFQNGEVAARALSLYHCANRASLLQSRTAYDGTGTQIPEPVMPPQQAAPIAPGSVADGVLNFVCGRSQDDGQAIADPAAHAVLTFRQAVGATQQAAAPEQGALGTGTGFFVGAGGDILTSYHVIGNARAILVITATGERLPATVVRASPSNDLAVLRVNWRPSQYLGFATAGGVRVGDRIFTMGFPAVSVLGAGEPRFTDGTVSALSGPGGDSAWMQISAPVQPGNSGGPLLNEAGQVVGVIAAQVAVEAFMASTGTLPQNINWAVKAEFASPLLGSPAPAPARPRAQAIALARAAVCLIVVEMEPSSE